MNPENFKAAYISKEEIEKVASEIRNKYLSTHRIPVEVLSFAEFDLNLEFEFAHIQHLGYDAFLRPDLTGIWFDREVFKNQSFQRRLRFTTAHELAHLFLHKGIYEKLTFLSVEKWIKFIGDVPLLQYQRIEWQADEFAGRFLMPTKELSRALDQTMEDLEREGFLTEEEERVLELCCQSMHSDFGVSFPAMQTRLRKSTLWPHPKLSKASK